MFIVYSNRQMLPVIREVEKDASLLYRESQEAIDVREPKIKEDNYAKILEEIDEEYIKEHSSD